MKAIVVHEYGAPEVLKFEDYPDPIPGAGEVLVRVAASPLNCGVEKRRSDVSLPVAIGQVFTWPPQSGLTWL